MAIGTISIDKRGLTPITKNVDVEWRPARDERRRQEADSDKPDRTTQAHRIRAQRILSIADSDEVAGHPAFEDVRRKLQPLASEESEVEKSLLDLQRPSVREAVAKAQAPLKASVKKSADKLGIVHLQEFDSAVAEKADLRRIE
jgi:hypothetical protein